MGDVLKQTETWEKLGWVRIMVVYGNQLGLANQRSRIRFPVNDRNWCSCSFWFSGARKWSINLSKILFLRIFKSFPWWFVNMFGKTQICAKSMQRITTQRNCDWDGTGWVVTDSVIDRIIVQLFLWVENYKFWCFRTTSVGSGLKKLKGLWIRSGNFHISNCSSLVYWKLWMLSAASKLSVYVTILGLRFSKKYLT